METCFLLWQLVFWIAIGFGFASSCPGQLAKSCVCEYHMSGISLTCRNITAGLNNALSMLEKLRVDRLTIKESLYPVLKRFPPIPVRALRLVSCSIGEVEPDAFAHISEELEELVLANNSLTKFPALGVLPKLEILNLNYNKLKIIPDDVLDGIGHVRYLRLRSNDISDISSNAFSAAKYTLELLDLSRNKLTKVPSDVVSNSENLMYLDLSGNKIDKLASLDFRNLPELKELRLNDNRISVVESVAFKNVPRLESFYLQGNPLSGSDAIKLAETFQQLNVIEISTERPAENEETPQSAQQGEAIPGAAKETENGSLEKHTSKVDEKGIHMTGKVSASGQSEGLHNELPNGAIMDTVKNSNLPFENVEQVTQVESGTKLPSEAAETSNNGLNLADISLSPELFKMLKLLPENYDISKIPKEVIQSVSRGELPDFTLLPADLREHVLANFPKLFGESPKEVLIDEDLRKKLPESEKTEVIKPSPDGRAIEYDGNVKTESSGQSNFYYYAIAAIVLVTVASVVILSVICFSLKCRRHPVADGSSLKRPEYSSFIESTPLTGAVRSPQFRIAPRPNALYR